MMIYKLLLRFDRPIPHRDPLASPLVKHVSPCPIIRTCRQMYNESLPILYGENTFSLLIREFCDIRGGILLNCNKFGTLGRQFFGNRLKYIRRFNITVRDDCDAVPHVLTDAIKSVCNVLSDIPCLEHLQIDLKSSMFDKTTGKNLCGNPRFLRNFTSLRAKDAIILGVPPIYARYLVSEITRTPHQDALPKMYEALETYAGPYDSCSEDLQQAFRAMEEEDVDRFKYVRAKLIKNVEKLIIKASSHLFDHG